MLNLGILCDALTELSDVSFMLQKENMTLPAAHQLLSSQLHVFRATATNPRRFATETREAIKAMKFNNVMLKRGSKSDVAIRREQFFISLAANFERRMQDKAGTFEKEYSTLMDDLQCLDPTTWPTDCDILHGDSQVSRLCQRFHLED